MSNIHTDESQPTANQQRYKKQDKEVPVDEKDKLNTPSLQNNTKQQFSQEKVQNNQLFKKEQQGQKYCKKQSQFFQGKQQKQDKEKSVDEKDKQSTALQNNTNAQFNQQKVQSKQENKKIEEASVQQQRNHQINSNLSCNNNLQIREQHKSSSNSLQEPNQQNQKQIKQEGYINTEQHSQTFQASLLQNSISFQITPQCQDYQFNNTQRQTNQKIEKEPAPQTIQVIQNANKLVALQENYKSELQKMQIEKDKEIAKHNEKIHQYTTLCIKLKNDQIILKRELDISKSNLRQAQQNIEEFQQLNNQMKQKLKEQTEKTQLYLLEIFNLKTHIVKLSQQKEQYCVKIKDLQTQLEQITSQNQSHVLEIMENKARIEKQQYQIKLKDLQIVKLTAKVNQLQQFHKFKLKEECELSALTTLIKRVIQQNCNNLFKQLTNCKREVQEDITSLKNRLEYVYKINQEKLKEKETLYQEKLKEIQQIHESASKGQQQITKQYAQRNEQLVRKLSEVQEGSCQFLKFYQQNIDKLQQQVNKLQIDKIELQEKHKKQKQGMLIKLCQYAKQLNNLETELQNNHITQMEQNCKNQVTNNWLSDKLQHVVTQYDDYKSNKEIQISHLQKEVQILKSKLKKSVDLALQRQANIVQTVCQYYSNFEKESFQCFSYRDKGKDLLINQLNQIISINQKVYEGNLMLKTSNLQQQTEEFNQLKTDFLTYKGKSQSVIQNLYNEKWEIQYKLTSAQQAKQSKIQIERQYASKEDTLNDIIFKLQTQNQNSLNLQDAIKCFMEIDTNREFNQFVSILDSIRLHYDKIQNQYVELQKQLDQKKEKQSILEKQRNEAQSLIAQLKIETANKESILNSEKNRYITLSTQQAQLQHDLQVKQAIMGQLKCKVDQLIKQNKRMVESNKSKKDQEFYEEEIKRLQSKMEQLVQQNKKNNQANQSKQQLCQKLSKKNIELTEENIRLKSNRVTQPDNTKTLSNLEIQYQKKLTQEYKQRLKYAQNKLKQNSLTNVSQREFKSLEQKLNQYKQQINYKQNQIKDLANQLTLKNKQLEVAKFSIQKYQQQQKQIQKDKRPRMVSPVTYQSSENTKVREIVKSPLKFQIKDNTKKSVILEGDHFSQLQLFKESNIFIRNEDEQFFKNTIQKFTGKTLLSAQLKFKMQLSKPDYLNEAKNAIAVINTANLAWVFKKQGQIFGALSFNKEIKQQHSAVLFNIAKKKEIYPANMRSSWVPIKSDSFYLYFGVQEAKYIWKSRMLSISDSKAIKYFDQNTPLVGNFVSKEKLEVQQFQIFLLNIQK